MSFQERARLKDAAKGKKVRRMVFGLREVNPPTHPPTHPPTVYRRSQGEESQTDGLRPPRGKPPTHPPIHYPDIERETHPPTHPPTPYLPTHLPKPSKQHLIPTASSSSTFPLTTHPPTHPPTQVMRGIRSRKIQFVVIAPDIERSPALDQEIAEIRYTSHPPTHPPTYPSIHPPTPPTHCG